MAAPGEIDWNDLRYFLRAAKAGTLVGAARAMGVEHTTIGRRLSALERTLGAPLALRGPEGIQLTYLGAKVARGVEDVERAVDAVRDLVVAQKPRVRLIVPAGFAGVFTEALARLRGDRPDLALEISSGGCPDALSTGDADLAICGGPIADESLVARKLCESGWSLYASPLYLARRPAPADPDDLAGHDLIGFGSSLASVPAARWLEERAGRATIVQRGRDIAELVAAARSGAGLAVLPCVLGDAEPSLQRLTPRVLATRIVSLVYRREARLSEEIRAAVAFVMDFVRENAERIRGLPLEP